MINYREAQQIIRGRARSFGRERLDLSQADGRVLAETIRADRDYPPFHRATMDGYAVRQKDLDGGLRHFVIVETIYAGAAATKPLPAGGCYKIMTGAPVPEGVDMVIRREDTVEGKEAMDVRTDARGLPAEASPGAWPAFLNIARRGEDLRSGDTVIEHACRCEPAILGLLATLGKKEVTVERLPRIALLTTGNEVVPVEATVGPAKIRNSNRWLLESSLKKWGIVPAYYTHCPDDAAILKSRLEPVLSHDILLLCGGVSAGDADHVPEVLEQLGVQKLFHKIAIKPGKPTWCGVTPGGGLVFALPGNPFSCLVNFALLIGPYLHACFGLYPPEPIGLPLGTSRKKKTPLDEFFPVRLQGTPGRLIPIGLNGSGDIRMGLGASGLALHPSDAGDLAEDAGVLYYPFG
jgi:molybdopterin molybdotransferase